MKMFSIGVFAALAALASLINPDAARAQNERNCAWPLEVSPEGSGNFIWPDTYSRYWLMPFEQQYQAMTIKGAYPHARYFSFVAYDGKAPVDVAGHLYDAQIAPDRGGVNPFVPPNERNAHPAGDSRYTVVIARNGKTSGNTIAVSSSYDWVALRVYAPSSDPHLNGRSLMGGVPLPSITLTDRGGARKELKPCDPVNKLQDVSAFVQILFPPGVDLIGSEGTPSSDRLWFGAPTVPPVLLMPNPDNKYIFMMPGNYQPGRLILIHGKAPGFPDTYHGASIWTPSPGFRTIDMRYWSVCHHDLAFPMSTVNCTADLATSLEDGSYTIVITDDLLRPDWLPSNVNWLQWGDEQYPKAVFFRNMLPAPSFHNAIQDAIAAGCTFDLTLPNIPARAAIDKAGQCAQRVMGEYYPVAVWCDKSTFVRGGWQACIKGQRP